MERDRPTPETVAARALALGRTLDAAQARGLCAYLDLLQTWNARTNLVGPRHWPAMLEELVADSWHLADLLAGLDIPADALSVDFGAGAGIPGIPLRLFWDAGEYLLVEPRAKRAAFLRQCAAMMRLPRVRVFEGRCEALGDKALVCLSRAFQPWARFLETARQHWEPAAPGRTPLAVVFAGAEAPEAPVPEGFVLTHSRAYPKKGGQGYFWVFSPNIS